MMRKSKQKLRLVKESIRKSDLSQVVGGSVITPSFNCPTVAYCTTGGIGGSTVCQGTSVTVGCPIGSNNGCHSASIC